MQRPQPTSRPGFTLVELLMVIVIIGILASLLIVAVAPVIGTANNAVVKTEINQLDIALNNYRDTYGALPPTMVTSRIASPGSGNSTIEILYNENRKQQRFLRHVRKMFPRFRGTYLQIAGTPAAPTVPTANNGILSSATVFAGGGVYATTIDRCWLDHMDAAESLVFWLGGIPKIWNANDATYEVELTGFSSDPTNPFLPEYDNPGGGGTVGVTFQPERTPPLFEFDPRRLVDSDKDGWPEYVPDMGGTAAETPPYAYFDAGTYGLLPYYPPNNHPSLSTWGVARPYLTRYTSATNALPLPGSFAAAETFQILCAGADLKYSTIRFVDPSGTYGDTNNDTVLTQPEVEQLVNVLLVYLKGQTRNRLNSPATIGSIDGEQFDNLTNFAESKLENEFGGSN